MTRFNMDKEFIYLDFKNNRFEFFDLEFVRIGYNDIQIIMTSGKLGNKGRTVTKRFNDGDEPFKEAMKYANTKKFEMKKKGYVSVGKMETALKQVLRKESSDKHKYLNKNHVGKKCDICKIEMNNTSYHKIDQWGRDKEKGNWDYSKDSPLYKKVACFDCQIEYSLFQKRFDKDNKIRLE